MQNLDEIIMLVLGLVVLGFVISNYARLKRFPAVNDLILSFCLLLIGCVFTIVEQAVLFELMNFAEHLCYLASAVWLCKWCLAISRNPICIRP